jgi:hypothetical protein
MWLIPKTPPIIVLALGVIFGLLLHPAWNFWWIEKSIYRRVSAISILAVGLCLIGYYVWPQLPVQAKSSELRTPQSFSLTDPHLILVRKYQIPKDVGAKVSVGNCPSEPCLFLSLDALNMTQTPPNVHFTIGGTFGGVYGPRMNVSTALKEGCGFTFYSGYYNLVFEIINDHATTLEAWAAIFPGTLEKGNFRVQGRYY